MPAVPTWAGEVEPSEVYLPHRSKACECCYCVFCKDTHYIINQFVGIILRGIGTVGWENKNTSGKNQDVPFLLFFVFNDQVSGITD